MNDKKKQQAERIQRYAHMIEQQTGKAVRPYRTDGYMNMMNRYGTSKDTTEHYKFAPEPDIPDDSLTLLYEGNGLFAKVIDAPAEEAIKHGFTLKDVSDQEVESFYQEALDELDWEEVAMTGIKWARLFGGAIAVMLINDGGGLEEPLNWKRIKSIDDIRVYDRSVIQPDYSTMFKYDPRDPFRTRGSRLGMPEFYHVNSRYGSFTVHESRCLVFQNGVLPENCSNTNYQLWGMPEYIRIHRAIRDSELAHGTAPKMLDRSVQPVYKMKDLSVLLATDEGESQVLKRLQVIDLARSFLSSLVIDSENEDYDFKSFQFTGVADVIDATCNYLSALTNIPQTILFGRSPAGMNSTGESDLENWYSYVQRIQKRMLKSNLRYLLSVIFQAGVRTGEVDEVPKIKIEFNPLKTMSDSEQAELDSKKAATALVKAQTVQLYRDMEVIDSTEIRRSLADSDKFDIDTILDEYESEEDLMAIYEQQEAENPGLIPGLEQTGVEPFGLPSGAAAHASAAPKQLPTGVDVEEHETDPGTEGSAPANAPAATKLPQDMSEQEKEEITNQDEAPYGVGVLVVKDGKILCGFRHNDSGYGLICGPGGHGEKGETYEQSAIRETQEEFGITPKELIPVGIGPLEPESGLRSHIFLCTDFDGEVSCDGLEIVNPMFVTMEKLEMLEPSLFPPFADSLEILKDCLFNDNEDGGPGSGNFGHKGVPGEVGGSAPSGKGMNGRIKDAYGSGDYTNVGREVRKCLKELPIGAKFTFAGGKWQKTGDDEFTAEDKFYGNGAPYKYSCNQIANNTNAWKPETAPVFEEIDVEEVAEAKVESGKLDPKKTSVSVPEGADLKKAPTGSTIRNENGVWQKMSDGDGYMNLETGEWLAAEDLQKQKFETVEYTGKTDFKYKAGRITQDTLNKKLWEMNRNNAVQTGEANITSKDVEDMVQSVCHYGLGGDCQLILSTQDPDMYRELLMHTSLSDDERKQFTAEAERIERFIALSDKVEGPVYRGITFNSAYSDPDVFERTLSKLKVGETIEMGHISSWSTNRGTAKSYAYGAADQELEDGDNYAIVYTVRSNRSAVSLSGINPEGECLTPKDAKYKVSEVKKTYDEDMNCYNYDVELEEI